MWHDKLHSFLWVWVCVPVRGSLCLFWHETHTKSLCARFPTRPEENEGRQGPRDTRTEQASRQERAVNRCRRKPTARTSGPRSRVGQRERMSQHSWWLCGNFARIHTRHSSPMHRKLCKSVTNFSPFFHLELTQVHVCLFHFPPPSRLCMMCFMYP